MPKRGERRSCQAASEPDPFWAKAAKTRSASASLATVMDWAKRSSIECQHHRLADAQARVDHLVLGAGSAARATSRGGLIRPAGMRRAVRQALDRRVSAEPEILRVRLADRPAAFPLAQFHERALVAGVDRRPLGGKLRLGADRHENLMLGDD